MAVYPHYEHAISYKRLLKLFDGLYGLKISQAAMANLFQRVKPSFDAQFSAILARLRQSRIGCSDETGAPVKGRNAWEWIFQNDEVCVHVIGNSRAKAMAEEVMDGHGPAIWVSDLVPRRCKWNSTGLSSAESGGITGSANPGEFHSTPPRSLRSLRRPTGPRGGMANLSGPSVARLSVRH
jgi:hypothetical protein